MVDAVHGNSRVQLWSVPSVLQLRRLWVWALAAHRRPLAPRCSESDSESADRDAPTRSRLALAALLARILLSLDVGYTVCRFCTPESVSGVTETTVCAL
eukprot:1373754-Prymnesium_polylepis.1